jgi:hypothetical protein
MKLRRSTAGALNDEDLAALLHRTAALATTACGRSRDTNVTALAQRALENPSLQA